MIRALRPRRLAIALAVAIVAGSVWTVVGEISSTPVSQPIVEQPVPPVVQEPLEETDLAQVKSVLGPFVTIVVSADSPTPETRSPAVLILHQDGGTSASQNWTIPFDTTSWSRRDAFQIRSLSSQLGYVTIGSNLQRTFVVKANQPFLFEDAPQQLCMIDAQGNTWATTTARAQAARQAL